MTDLIQVDWEMCASISGYKNAGVAYNQWIKLKSKKGLTRTGNGSTIKATAKKRKLDGAGNGDNGTPTPAAKKRGI